MKNKSVPERRLMKTGDTGPTNINGTYYKNKK